MFNDIEGSDIVDAPCKPDWEARYTQLKKQLNSIEELKDVLVNLVKNSHNNYRNSWVSQGLGEIEVNIIRKEKQMHDIAMQIDKEKK